MDPGQLVKPQNTYQGSSIAFSMQAPAPWMAHHMAGVYSRRQASGASLLQVQGSWIASAAAPTVGMHIVRDVDCAGA